MILAGYMILLDQIRYSGGHGRRATYGIRATSPLERDRLAGGDFGWPTGECNRCGREGERSQTGRRRQDRLEEMHRGFVLMTLGCMTRDQVQVQLTSR